MTITTISSRDFARNLADAKKAARDGPVIITDRGQPTYALLRIDDYYRLAGAGAESLITVMDSIPGGNFVFEPPVLDDNDIEPPDFH